MKKVVTRAVGTASTFFIIRTQRAVMLSYKDRQPEARKARTICYFPVCAGRHHRLSGSELARQHYAGGRAIKSLSLGSASATVRGRPKLAANTSGGFEATHALRSWE